MNSNRAKNMKIKEYLEVFEIIFNTINHVFIGITTFYMTWYCFNVGFDELITYHVLFTTLGVRIQNSYLGIL